MADFVVELTKFDSAHGKLQGVTREVCSVVEELFTIQDTLSEIHEYWMDSGLHDVAHDVIPVLDRGERLLIMRFSPFRSSSAFNSLTQPANFSLIPPSPQPHLLLVALCL